VGDAKTTPDRTQPDAAPSNGTPPGAQAGDQRDELSPEASAELQELRKKAAERDQFLDLAQRTRADFENYQKRNQREREQERQFMAGQFVLDILPVLDNLERATAQQAGEKGPLVQGVAMVHQQFLDLLKRYGVTRIEAEGQPFDANRHQALAQQPAADKPANTVLQVVEQGYMLHDRVLRPAKVVVSQAGPQGQAGAKK
jgi:molecular chaperone GrpE